MKRFVIGLIALALLAASASADWVINSYRLAGDVTSRPVLEAVNAAGISATNQSSRTLSITPPVGTTLVVTYVAWRHANVSSAPSTPTLGGTALTAARAMAQYQNRLTDGIYYRVNPTTGSAQDLVIAAANSWTNSYIYVWFFSNVNTTTPIGDSQGDQSVSAASLSVTLGPQYGRPYLVGGSHRAHASGTGNCWSGTNLTVANQGNEASNHTYAAFANSTLTFASDTLLTATCSWGASYQTLDVVEIKGP